MIDVRVSDENVRYCFTAQGPKQTIDMRLQQRTGIDHGDLSMANDIGTSSKIRVGAWVFGNDPADQS